MTRRFQFVIPAHDEESGIAETVRSCRQVDYPKDLFEVVVVAHNCRDRTGPLAREAGARVVVLDDPTTCGKGAALSHHFDALLGDRSQPPPDAVVVVDADSVVDAPLLREFSARLDRGFDWVQGFDTVANVDDSWRTMLMTHAFGLINGVLQLGLSGWGLSAGFRGNGMCLSTDGLRRYPWRSHGLTEDLEYSWSIRAAGETIAFAPRACVRARMLAGGGLAAANQRRRWEFGRRELRFRMLGPLLRSPRLGPLAKLAAVVELWMPSLVVLFGLVCVSWLVTIPMLLDASAASSPWPKVPLLGLVVFATASLLSYGLSPFALLDVPKRVLLTLVFVPFYAAWKLVTYLRGRPGSWIRTSRL